MVAHRVATGAVHGFRGAGLLHIKDPDGTEPNALIVMIRTNDVVCGVGYCKE